MKLIINKHRRDETAEIDDASRVRWEYPDGRYVEVYLDEFGQLLVASADTLIIQAHASNRVILVPLAYNGQMTHERLGTVA